jgi:hypothetical protein
MKAPIIGSISVILLLSLVVCGLSLSLFNKSQMLNVDTVASNPSVYVNQTVTVKGILSSLPQPRPTEYELSSENRTVFLYVEWISSQFLISDINDTTAIVHGVVREENWVSPNAMPANSLIMHIYYIEANSVELFNDRE